MRYLQTPLLVSVLLISLAVVPVSGEEPADTTLTIYEMEPMVITATRTPHQPFHVPRAVTMVGSRDLVTHSPLSVLDALTS